MAATATTTRQTILITGANEGLGSAIVEHITSKPEYTANHGLYTVRDPTNAPALSSALSHGPTHSHDIVKLDLNKLDSIREVAQEINVSLAQPLLCVFTRHYCFLCANESLHSPVSQQGQYLRSAFLF